MSDLAAIPGALAGRKCSVLLADATFDKADLERTLQQSAEAHPEIIRLVIAETADGSGSEVRGAHQFLPAKDD